jgi:hypothetical protein
MLQGITLRRKAQSQPARGRKPSARFMDRLGEDRPISGQPCALRMADQRFLRLVAAGPLRHIPIRGHKKRIDTMTLLKRLFPRRLTRQELEYAYLNQAVSRYDLERREREITQGRFA